MLLAQDYTLRVVRMGVKKSRVSKALLSLREEIGPQDRLQRTRSFATSIFYAYSRQRSTKRKKHGEFQVPNELPAFDIISDLVVALLSCVLRVPNICFARY